MIVKTFNAMAIGAAMTAAVGLVAMSGTAEARRGGPSVIEQSYIVPGPYKGYSGFVPSGGPRSYYCDYQRIPNRQCTVGRDGREKCKIVNWTLKQACY